jgi:hypothetical protein
VLIATNSIVIGYVAVFWPYSLVDTVTVGIDVSLSEYLMIVMFGPHFLRASTFVASCV